MQEWMNGGGGGTGQLGEAARCKSGHAIEDRGESAAFCPRVGLYSQWQMPGESLNKEVGVDSGVRMNRHLHLERVQPGPCQPRRICVCSGDSLLLDFHGELGCQAITRGRLAAPVVGARVIGRVDGAFGRPDDAPADGAVSARFSGESMCGACMTGIEAFAPGLAYSVDATGLGLCRPIWASNAGESKVNSRWLASASGESCICRKLDAALPEACTEGACAASAEFDLCRDIVTDLCNAVNDAGPVKDKPSPPQVSLVWTYSSGCPYGVRHSCQCALEATAEQTPGRARR